MATETVLDIVAILRKCDGCHTYKDLGHFLLRGGADNRTVVGSARLCVPCRRYRYKGEGKKLARGAKR